MLAYPTFRKRLATGLVALVCCAALSPAASAMIPDSGGGSKPGDSASSFERHYLAVTGDGRGMHAALVARHTTLFHEPIAAPTTPEASAPLATPATGNGFDWSDASVGMGIGMGVTVLLAAAVALGRRRPSAALPA
jgi:hypothetical protein